MGLLLRLFGVTRDAIALPHFDAGSKAVELSAAVLRECVDHGCAGHAVSTRGRLARPFARGYLFGFSDTCMQRFGVFEELESLALITVVHGRLFGRKIGSLLVHEALRDQHHPEFCRGRAAGAADLLRWMDTCCTPSLLTEYLQASDDAGPVVRTYHPHERQTSILYFVGTRMV